MSKKLVVIHTVTVLLLSGIVAFFINMSNKASVVDYISGVGSVASIYGVLVALWQLRQIKSTADAAKEAAEKKSAELDAFVSFADVNRYIEVAKRIPAYLTYKNQYEAAIIYMEQLKEELIDVKRNQYIDGNDIKLADSYVLKLGTDIGSIRKQIVGVNSLDVEMVITHVSNICTFLQEISSKIKDKKL